MRACAKCLFDIYEGTGGAGLTAGPSPMTDPAGTSPVLMLLTLPLLSTLMLSSL